MCDVYILQRTIEIEREMCMCVCILFKYKLFIIRLKKCTHMQPIHIKAIAIKLMMNIYIGKYAFLKGKS